MADRHLFDPACGSGNFLTESYQKGEYPFNFKGFRLFICLKSSKKVLF
ncbi:DNA methyltransferase [Selenomonas sp.]